MYVVVGSTNPVKIAATERALTGERVEGASVGSGVPEQPRGHAETIRGAVNRAERALRSEPGADLGVGIEGGVADLAGDDWQTEPGGESALFLVMWAAVSDGSRTNRGSGPSIRLPERLASRVRDGEELGAVLDDHLDTEGVGSDQGAAGVLTDGIIDRESALVHAVAGALGPFVTGLYGRAE